MDETIAVALLFVSAIIGLMIILPIVAIVKLSGLSGQLGRLRSEVEALRSSVRRLQAPPETVHEPPMQAKAEESAEEVRHEILERIVTPPAPPIEVPQPEAPVAPTPPPAPPPPPVQTWHAPASERPAKPARSSLEWELLIGESFFNRIGAVAILIGIALLLSYAYKHHRITPQMLFCIGMASGTALVLGGVYFHKRGARVFAQGLLGAGISILYLTVYAAFNIYNLIGSTIAFGMMSATTAVAILLALKYDSIAISLLGLIGGFLTPVILKSNPSGGGSSASGLFIYLVLLDVGLLGVAIKKESWVILEPLTLLGTYLIYWVWHDSSTPQAFCLP